jgi:hypothetical protein
VDAIKPQKLPCHSSMRCDDVRHDATPFRDAIFARLDPFSTVVTKYSLTSQKCQQNHRTNHESRYLKTSESDSMSQTAPSPPRAGHKFGLTHK